MFSKAKRLVLTVDGVPFVSTKAPEPIDEWDGSCPACGSTRYHETVTLIQHGFTEDDCLSIIHCEDCFEAFHYAYKVEAAALDAVILSGI